MALTIEDILALPGLNTFQLIAGKGGLHHYVITEGIADYEFAEGIHYHRPEAFERDSIVISSLLFAKDNPALILPAVRALRESGVAAFAYKQILFDRLPDSVIAYADEYDFPIFSFGEDIWFENIIFDVMTAVERDDARHLSQSHLEKMIAGAVSQQDVNQIRRGISLLLHRSVSAAYVKAPDLDASRVYRSYYMCKNLREKLLVAPYEDGIFLLITTPKWEEASHRVILEEACQSLALPLSSHRIIISRIHAADELDKAFREAYYAWTAGLIFRRETARFDDLGVYAALLPLAGTPELKSYAENYLKQLAGYEETISAYVKNGGDVVATSVDLCCHANTVRYRLHRMKALVHAPGETDHELFRDLSIAYLIRKLSRQD